MNAGWAVREDWAAANLASFSNGFEKLKTVGDKLQEHSKKVKFSMTAALRWRALQNNDSGAHGNCIPNFKTLTSSIYARV